MSIPYSVKEKYLKVEFGLTGTWAVVNGITSKVK
jgi:hypothetical protein